MYAFFIQFALAQQSPPIVNGQTTSDFPSVGMFFGCSSANSNNCWVCSGTVIAPNWVLTAAHCVDDMSANGDNYFIVGPSWDNYTDGSEILAWYPHEQYSSNRNNIAHDIALIELKTPIYSVTRMTINIDYVDNSWRGRELDMVGYGVTGSNRQDSTYKRTADMYIDEVFSYTIMMEDISEQQNVCSGDSGGAALYYVESTGTYEIIGVHSFTAGACENWEAGIVPVDRYITWMEEKGVTINGTYDEPNEPSEPGSEPGSESTEWMVPFDADDYDEDNDEMKAAYCGLTAYPVGNFGALLFCLGLIRRRR